MTGRTITAIDTEIAEVRAAMSKVYARQAYTQGDRSVQASRIAELQQREAALTRERNEVTAANNGASNPFAVTAKWS